MLSNEELLFKRTKGDPLADSVVEKIIASGNGEKVGKLFNTLTQNVDVPTKDLPEEAIEYFKNTKEVPYFFNEQLIYEGQEVYRLYGPEISMILMCKSLPQCYACGKGAKVLYGTGRLLENNDDFERLTRRLMETAQFVMNVLAPSSFKETGKAIITTQKIRLIHASIRYFIKSSGKWDYNYYGVPINQEDLAGTLMSFSALVLEGLEQMGIELKEREKEAFFHVWRVVGHIIGLDKDLIPETHQEGRDLGYAIFNQQLASSKEGIALTRSAIKFMQHVAPLKKHDKLPEDMVYFFLGPKDAAAVGLVQPSGCLASLLPKAMHKFFGDLQKVETRLSPELKRITEEFNHSFLTGLLNYFNKGKNVTFDIPPSLQKDWNLIDSNKS